VFINAFSGVVFELEKFGECVAPEEELAVELGDEAVQGRGLERRGGVGFLLVFGVEEVVNSV
jgi:hypothetical protein